MANIEEHIIFKLRNARVLDYPFPHFYAENVFPSADYDMALSHLPDQRNYVTMGGNYNARFFADPVFVPEFDFTRSKWFCHNVLQIFGKRFFDRFPDGKFQGSTESRLVRDRQSYQIGPHTDAAWKVISLLFYLPMDEQFRQHGTSIYVPEDHKRRCPGGPHHGFEGFQKVYTAPFVPNSCFGFWKTDNSFHGVEQINEEICRDVLLYNIYADKGDKDGKLRQPVAG